MGSSVPAPVDPKPLFPGPREPRGPAATPGGPAPAGGPVVEPLEGRILFVAGVLGTVTSDFGGSETAIDVAAQKDGRVVVLGRTGAAGAGGGFFLVRYNADGSLDTTFGQGGRVVANFPEFREPAALAVTGGGRGAGFVVAGVADGPAPGGGDAGFAAVRFDSRGDVDDDFGDGGLAFLDAGAGEHVGDVAADSRSVVIAGDVATGGSQRALVAVKLHLSNGEPDGRFGGGGVAVINSGRPVNVAAAVALDKGSKVLVGGYDDSGVPGASDSRLVVARFARDGSPDAGFGAGGLAVIDPGPAAVLAGLTMARGGKVVAAGNTLTAAGAPDDLVVAQLTRGGNLDPAFAGGAGFVVTDFGAASAAASGVGADSKGRIYVAGHAEDAAVGAAGDNRLLLARYTKSASPDRGFGGGAILADVTPGAASSERAAGLALQPGGTAVVVGDTEATPAADGDARDLALVRYTDKLGPSGSARLRDRDDVLEVRGTSRADVISVTEMPGSPTAAAGVGVLSHRDDDDDEDDGPAGTIVVTINGESFGPFDARDVDFIEVRAGSGDDEVTISDDGAEFIFARGDDGDDILRVVGSTDAELRGDRGDDKLFGGDGDDDLIGGRGEDRMAGGDGDDLFLAFDGYEDDIDGGPGDDEADADAFDETASVARVFL